MSVLLAIVITAIVTRVYMFVKGYRRVDMRSPMFPIRNRNDR